MKRMETERIVLRPKEIQALTGWGKVQVYNLWKRPDFPGKRNGTALFVSRQAFLDWLEERDQDLNRN